MTFVFIPHAPGNQHKKKRSPVQESYAGFIIVHAVKRSLQALCTSARDQRLQRHASAIFQPFQFPPKTLKYQINVPAVCSTHGYYRNTHHKVNGGLEGLFLPRLFPPRINHCVQPKQENTSTWNGTPDFSARNPEAFQSQRCTVSHRSNRRRKHQQEGTFSFEIWAESQSPYPKGGKQNTESLDVRVPTIVRFVGRVSYH